MIVDEMIVDEMIVVELVVVFATSVLLLTVDEATGALDTDGAAPQVGVVPFVQGMVSMYTGEH